MVENVDEDESIDGFESKEEDESKVEVIEEAKENANFEV